MSELTKSDLIKKLRLLDDEASLRFTRKNKLQLVIVGGSALMLLDVITRVTSDIDAIRVSYELQEFLSDYNINTRVVAYESFFPYGYEDRLVKLQFQGKRIDFFTASLEDIVIAKLHSARKKDKEDIENKAVIAAIDWDLLEKLATAEDEVKASSLNSFRYNEFLDSYHDYVKRCKP